ncbi:MAG: SAM-dependent chlorinase/fluorinase [Deltaproteobacteria bacterium]|nr:SAM-dependent chlorinase/fluorinase [Deltaproteobacteria bacterium]
MTTPGTGGLITLLTDFGTRDEYVACMKGVILSLNPQARLVDLTHEIPPQDIRAGAFILAAAAPYFPAETIHLAVVDPGVGTGRRALAAQVRDQFWVGPDNGLFHLIFAGQEGFEMVSLENPDYFLPQVSATFHGRDIFAPAAAHLSLGATLAQLGPAIADPVRLPWPEPVVTAATLKGEIIHVDRFGNLVSNVSGGVFHNWRQGRDFRIKAGPLTLTRLRRTYGEAAAGEVLALIGSHGYLEIACANGSAAARLQAGPGLSLEIRLIE